MEEYEAPTTGSTHKKPIDVSHTSSHQRPSTTIITSFPLYSEICLQQLRQALQLSEQHDQDSTFQRQNATIGRARFYSVSDDDDHGNSNDDHGTMEHQYRNVEDLSESDDDAAVDVDADDRNQRTTTHRMDSVHSDSDEMKEWDVRQNSTMTSTDRYPTATSSLSPIVSSKTTTGISTPGKHPSSNSKVAEFHPSIIRKHIDALSTLSFDIPSSSTDKLIHMNSSKNENENTTVTNRMELQLPACILSKEQLTYCDNDNKSYNHNAGSITTYHCRAYYELATSILSRPIIILLIRSGRFAGAVFQQGSNNNSKITSNHQNNNGTCCCTHHRTSVRYTVRKGQGKAQSSQDGQGRKAISIGSQLRRQGEIQLREDISRTIIEWREQFQNAALILISIPRTMQKGLFEHNDQILQRQDPRIRRIPLDVGRPTFENVCLIYQVLLTVTVREQQYNNLDTEIETIIESNTNTHNINEESKNKTADVDKEDDTLIIPLSELHLAAQNGDVTTLESLLDGTDDNDFDIAAMIDQPAGIDQMTPLHYAAESVSSTKTSKTVDPNHAAACIRLLLERGHANPCISDQRRRVPYNLAAQNDKVRDAFRISRCTLGEDYCDWDNDAKVGPPLSLDVLNDKLEKEAEKRRKKRLKQKEKKAREKIEEKAAEERRLALEEQQQKEEEAKRIRDGLQPKVVTTAGGKACDFCQTICVGTKRINMFKRLEYSYCTSRCLQNHKRELMAAAAMARMNNT
jgi:hypothetical protein